MGWPGHARIPGSRPNRQPRRGAICSRIGGRDALLDVAGAHLPAVRPRSQAAHLQRPRTPAGSRTSATASHLRSRQPRPAPIHARQPPPLANAPPPPTDTAPPVHQRPPPHPPTPRAIYQYTTAAPTAASAPTTCGIPVGTANDEAACGSVSRVAQGGARARTDVAAAAAAAAARLLLARLERAVGCGERDGGEREQRERGEGLHSVCVRACVRTCAVGVCAGGAVCAGERGVGGRGWLAVILRAALRPGCARPRPLNGRQLTRHCTERRLCTCGSASATIRCWLGARPRIRCACPSWAETASAVGARAGE